MSITCVLSISASFDESIVVAMAQNVAFNLALILTCGVILHESDASARTIFNSPPTQISIHNPSSTEGQRNRTTISVGVPQNAGASLGRIVLTQIVNADRWGWGKLKPEVYMGRYSIRGRGAENLAVAALSKDKTTLSVVFDPPIDPGRQVNVVMRGFNPDAGIYQWTTEITPSGPEPVVYYGPTLRLNIYRYNPRF